MVFYPQQSICYTYGCCCHSKKNNINGSLILNLLVRFLVVLGGKILTRTVNKIFSTLLT
jgi:hypothetical protein